MRVLTFKQRPVTRKYLGNNHGSHPVARVHSGVRGALRLRGVIGKIAGECIREKGYHGAAQRLHVYDGEPSTRSTVMERHGRFKAAFMQAAQAFAPKMMASLTTTTV